MCTREAPKFAKKFDTLKAQRRLMGVTDGLVLTGKY
jgi:hypothetical protein